MTNEEKAVAAIVDGLTEAETRVLLRPLGISTHAFYPAAAHRSCRSLVAKGCLRETADNIGNPTFVFEPLGLSVRQALTAAGNSGEIP